MFHIPKNDLVTIVRKLGKNINLNWPNSRLLLECIYLTQTLVMIYQQGNVWQAKGSLQTITVGYILRTIIN